ncbi:MAG: hypothetical protein D6800_13055 [Candidatus Zixiibacteriota bacterium]|nr:MAG: hypothetical protein D6800_13055 [candidate division Zixibacteria bacterium]
MLRISRRLWVAALFIIILLGMVNLAWWLYYQRTGKLLEGQLNRHLATTVQLVAGMISSEQLGRLQQDDIDTYIELAGFLDEVRQTDSLSEVFILDENYRYLVTTILEPDSLYFLRNLNGPYIDSLFFDPTRVVMVPPAYRSGSLRLKSAFAPLIDTAGVVTAVLGVEANVGYYDALKRLKQIFGYATVLSLLGGLIAGLIFVFLERRMGHLERQLMLNHTHAYLGRMVAVVAHELKNPLMIIRASAERLRKKTGLEEAGYVVEEVDRLNAIVGGYLEFARTERGLLERDQTESFDLIPLVHDLRTFLMTRYSEEPVTWLELPLPSSCRITGYRRSLRQVLLNLLLNGAEACQQAGKPIAVGMRVECTDSHVLIGVVDHGPGIRKSEIQRLFEPFHTTKQTGSGLGLFLSKKIIEDMHGTIEIVSEPGKMTEVRITIPRKADT